MLISEFDPLSSIVASIRADVGAAVRPDQSTGSIAGPKITASTKVALASIMPAAAEIALNPVAVPLLVIVAPESMFSVEPDSTDRVLAVNWKSSAPAILISIVSSVSAVILVSASASRISSVPFISMLEPVCTKNLLAVNWKSSAPAILMSI